MTEIPASFRLARFIAGIVVLVGWIDSLSVARAATPLPEFNGRRLVVVDEPAEPYHRVADQIAEIEKRTPQTYFLVVVRSSGEGPNATREYADALFAKWRARPADATAALDPERSVLIVLATQNRQLSVRAGTLLQSRYGLVGETIDRRLVAPHFLPHARSGDYPEGLTALLRQIDGWIAARDADDARRQEEAAARARQLEADAQAALAAARSLADEVAALLADRGDATSLTGVAKRLDDERTALAAARELAPRDPAAALARATQAQSALVQARNEIRQLTATQAEAAEMQQKVRGLADQAARDIDRQSRAGLTTDWAGARLDTLQSQLDAADVEIARNPAQALPQLGTIEASLAALREEVAGLPARRDELAAKVAAAKSRADAVRDVLARAASHGVPTATAEREFADVVERIPVAGALPEREHRQAIAALREVDASLDQLESGVGRLAAERRFQTRTLPAIASGSVALVAILTLAALRLLHLSRRRSLERRLREFKQQAVAISDRIDAMKERHRMLPFTDPDFTQPMTGRTLATWDGVQQALERHRVRWLSLMDTWEKAQRLLESERYFGRGKLATAAALLREPHDRAQTDAIERECVGPLDQLERAHEVAASRRAKIAEAESALRERIEALGANGVSIASYASPRASAVEECGRGEKILTPDPLGAIERFDQAQDGLSQLVARVERAQACFDGLKAFETLRLEVGGLFDARRRDGLRFCEPGTDPSPSLDQADGESRECRRFLDAGEIESAEARLANARELLKKSGERIEGAARARAWCRTDGAARRQELDRLRQSLAEARAHHDELRRDFAPRSWTDVANAPEQARTALDGCESILAEAAQAASDDVQHYQRATVLLAKAREIETRTAATLAAVVPRLDALRRERDACRRRLDELRRTADRLDAFLRSSTADRPQSNLRYRRGFDALQQASRDASLPVADWPGLSARLGEIESDFDAAERMAREDIRLADAASRELAETEREIRSAGSFYRHGFSANVAGATGQLQQARMAFERQDYEEAIRLANAAETSAQAARRDAERRADEAQRRLEQQRQQAQSASLLSTAAMHTVSTFGSIASASTAPANPSPSVSSLPPVSSSPPTPVSSPPPPASPTSSTTWASGTSQSSW